MPVRYRPVLALVGVALWLALPPLALAHGADTARPAFPGFLLAWRFEPIPIAAVLLAAIAYLAAARQVNAAHPESRHPAWRTSALLGGLGTILLALVSPVEAYAGSLFWVHMLQHMLLQFIAAPLLLLGAPVTVILRVAGPASRRRLLAVLHSRPVRLLIHPVTAWLLFAIVNWGWHFSPLYDRALESEPLHYLQHASMLGAALLFWWPVIAADPAPRRLPHPVRLLYLFLALPQNSFLGVALFNAGAPLYAHYVSNLRGWGPTPLEDQQLGGVLMWVGGDMMFVVALIAVVGAWMRYEDRRSARLDARLDAEAAMAARSASHADSAKARGASSE